MAQLVTGYVTRPVESRDEQAVLALVNADRVPGQPLATPAMLAEALAGRSGVDSGWWAELADLTTEVATTRAGQVVGAVSYASRPRDDAGVVLWLHGGEDRGVIDALLDHTLSRLGGAADRGVLVRDRAWPGHGGAAGAAPGRDRGRADRSRLSQQRSVALHARRPAGHRAAAHLVHRRQR